MKTTLTDTHATIETRYGVLCFPLTVEAAEAMTTEELRTLCSTNDPNGEWSRRTTLCFTCAACNGDGCDECDGDGNIVRDVHDDEEYIDEDVFELGCERADLIEGAVEFGQEILADEKGENE